jgi:hypothetical protein
MILTLIVDVNENYYHLLMNDQETRALIAGTLALMTHFAVEVSRDARQARRALEPAQGRS